MATGAWELLGVGLMVAVLLEVGLALALLLGVALCVGVPLGLRLALAVLVVLGVGEFEAGMQLVAPVLGAA